LDGVVDAVADEGVAGQGEDVAGEVGQGVE